MIAPQTEVYTRDQEFWLLPDVRDAINRRRDPDPDPERYAQELGYAEFQVRAALEALEIEGGVLS